MLIDFQRQSDACKRKGLKGIKRYHYLFFIGTDLEARGQGFATKIIKQYQRQATEENLPIWLEATTEHSRSVYERCGFKVVHVMSLGEGTHDEGGAKQKGGPGIRIWAMIWKPEKFGEKRQ